MGAVLESVQTCAPGALAFRPSSVGLAASAARGALRQRGLGLDAVELLINSGVYRDGHICEPAMAPLIQRAIRGRWRAQRSQGSAGLAFDLTNGAGGMLNALHGADALLRVRGLERALVVSSDVNPTPRLSEGYAFDPLGAAMLLRNDPSERGFAGFQFDTYVKHSDLFASQVDWSPVTPESERHVLRFSVREDEGFLDRASECTALSLQRFLGSRGLAVDSLDLLIAPHYPPGFPERLAEATGIPEDRVAHAPGCSYSSGPAAGLAAALEDGRFESAGSVLFVAVGAGITVGLALYRNEA